MVARLALSDFWRSRGGATAIEYALLVSLLGLVVITAAAALRAEIYDILLAVAESLD